MKSPWPILNAPNASESLEFPISSSYAMDYKPRCYQPFTLREAIALDVSVITEEISRLQNSLQKLAETQDVLKEEQDDPEVKQAFNENQQVISSQQERIAILEMALKEKGIVRATHYGSITLRQPPDIDEDSRTSETASTSDVGNNADEGVFL